MVEAGAGSLRDLHAQVTHDRIGLGMTVRAGSSAAVHSHMCIFASVWKIHGRIGMNLQGVVLTVQHAKLKITASAVSMAPLLHGKG